MTTSFLLRAVLLSLISLVRADNAFTSPLPGGTNVTEGSNFTIRWTTDWDSAIVNLTINQQTPNGGWFGQTLLNSVPDPGFFDWTAVPLKGLTIDNGFHFTLLLVSDDHHLFSSAGESFDSGAVFINDGSSSSTANETMSKDGPSASTRTGLGVGLGVGIPLLLLLVGVSVVVYRLYHKVSVQHSTDDKDSLRTDDSSIHGEDWTKIELHAESVGGRSVKSRYELA